MKQIKIYGPTSLVDPYKTYFKVTLECLIPTTDEIGSCIGSFSEYFSKEPKKAIELATDYATDATIEHIEHIKP